MVDMISDSYRDMNRELHKDPDYGVSAKGWVEDITHLARSNKFTSILDYGCGKGLLKTMLAKAAPEITVLEYDPAIEGKTEIPKTPADLLVALDVMEHIEPELLDNVLLSMTGAKPKLALLAISTTPAMKTLPDGRNAHILLHPKEWWAEKLADHFRPTYTTADIPGLFVYMGVPLATKAA